MNFKSHLFLSTCGTSLLTNKADEETRKLLITHSNAQEKDLSKEERARIERRVEERVSTLAQSNLSDAREMSAEINGIIGIYGNRLPERPALAKDLHFMFHTDTFEGECTAKVIGDWLERQGCKVQLYRMPEMRTNDLESFRYGLPEIVRWCEQTLQGYRDSGYKIIFNLTGGFKSLNGFMQTLGMFYADECIYLFESAKEIMRIPKLPVRIDEETAIGSHIEPFRWLASGKELEAKICEGIPETLLCCISGKAALSEWGHLVWERCHNKCFSEQLLPPLSDKIIYTTKMEKTCGELQPDLLHQVNHQLDQFAVYFETKDDKYNLRSLRFKPIGATAKPPSTHEFYAWSDGNASRFYGHFDEKKRFVVDALDRHL